MKLIFKIFLVLIFFVNPALALIDTNAKTLIIMDADTGYVLYEKNPNEKTFPASMTKIMTTMIVFEKLSNGSLTLDDTFIVSEKAWKEREGSSMFVEVDKEIRVEDLLRGIIVQSGNDACIVVAENISGSEETFSILMNEMASDIGLVNTNFSNSTGMHSVKNYSTVHDIALMSQYMINNYPEHYHLFSETELYISKENKDIKDNEDFINILLESLKIKTSYFGLLLSSVNDDYFVDIGVYGKSKIILENKLNKLEKFTLENKGFMGQYAITTFSRDEFEKNVLKKKWYYYLHQKYGQGKYPNIYDKLGTK